MKVRMESTNWNHRFKETEDKLNPDLEMAQDGFEHTACKYYKKDDIPQQDENKELLDLLKKVLK